jgi:hypothetical protein
MIDVAEAELIADRVSAVEFALPAGEDAPITHSEEAGTPVELDAWLTCLSSFAVPSRTTAPVQDTLLPASFAIASYRASLLPLLGDESESALQGGTAAMARLPLVFTPGNGMVPLEDPHVAAVSNATLSVKSESQPDLQHERRSANPDRTVADTSDTEAR